MCIRLAPRKRMHLQRLENAVHAPRRDQVLDSFHTRLLVQDNVTAWAGKDFESTAPLIRAAWQAAQDKAAFACVDNTQQGDCNPQAAQGQYVPRQLFMAQPEDSEGSKWRWLGPVLALLLLAVLGAHPSENIVHIAATCLPGRATYFFNSPACHCLCQSMLVAAALAA